ncbi:hypothetical protein RCL1_001093 [Eukaryota sp. TZLM3-RCL]
MFERPEVSTNLRHLYDQEKALTAETTELLQKIPNLAGEALMSAHARIHEINSELAEVTSNRETWLLEREYTKTLWIEFFDLWLQDKDYQWVHEKYKDHLKPLSMATVIAARCDQLKGNFKTCLPRIVLAWLKNFVNAQCRLLTIPDEVASKFISYLSKTNTSVFELIDIDEVLLDILKLEDGEVDALSDEDIFNIVMNCVLSNFDYFLQYCLFYPKDEIELMSQLEKDLLEHTLNMFTTVMNNYPVSKRLIQSSTYSDYSYDELLEVYDFIQHLISQMPTDPTLWRKLSIMPIASHSVKSIEIPHDVFYSDVKFPPKNNPEFNWPEKSHYNKVLRRDPRKYFRIHRSKDDFLNKISITSNGVIIFITFYYKDLTKAPKKRATKNLLNAKGDSNVPKSTKLKGTKKKPFKKQEKEEIQKKSYAQKPVVGIDPGRSRLFGYFGEHGQGIVLNPRIKKYTSPPVLLNDTSCVYTTDEFSHYIRKWSQVRDAVYEEGSRMKWRYLKFDFKKRKERRFSKALKTLLNAAKIKKQGFEKNTVTEAAYIAMGDAAFPSSVKGQKVGSVKTFTQWLQRKKEVVVMKIDEYNTSKFSGCCFAMTVQTSIWEEKICTGQCGQVIHRDISAAENIRLKGLTMLWPERYKCPLQLMRPEGKTWQLKRRSSD